MLGDEVGAKNVDGEVMRMKPDVRAFYLYVVTYSTEYGNPLPHM